MSVLDNIACEVQDHVKLNIGGSKFETTKLTLTTGWHMLAAILSGRMPIKKDEEGYVFFDRSGKHFEIILNYLRYGKVTLPKTKNEIEELEEEGRFYCMDEVVQLCVKALERLESKEAEATDAISNIGLISNIDQTLESNLEVLVEKLDTLAYKMSLL